ncbi:MAG: hypothetical protein LUC44_03480 [Prevotellaceae bacterium]|nr:hypothetical protein [Prevotellaceae bacterium]
MRRHRWLWIPSLFAAGEIPVTIITYVALLMFLQMGASPAVAAACCGCLFIPWTLKDQFSERLKKTGHFRRQIQLAELAMVLVLMGLALSFTHCGFKFWRLFACLLALSVVTAWHELVSRFYYDCVLHARERHLWNGVAMFFSQTAVVFTYGLVIMIVGALQVVCRSISVAWAQGCYVVAGVFLLFTVYHIFSLERPNLDGDMAAVVTDRGLPGAHRKLAISCLVLLMLPQSLMFFSRVVFLLTPLSKGGLGCTIQDIAFAQGAVGVIGFSVGLVLGRHLLKAFPVAKVFWPLAVALGLSPCVYALMVVCPPPSLAALCVATFSAQFLFGLGIPVCDVFLVYVSGERYQRTINYIYIPMLAGAMFLPLALSGWLVSWLGFGLFFAIDALLAPFSWLVMYFSKVRYKMRGEADNSLKVNS